jgi:diguanylate cyclase (GGDEF)-like protein
MREKVKSVVQKEFPIMHKVLKLLQLFGPRSLATELSQLLDERIEDNLDPVTGLVQRRFFMRALMQEVGKQLPELETSGMIPVRLPSLIVLVGDLAFLNYFNSISHRMGDQVLTRTGQILNDEFSTGIVSRIGGDEFAVLTTDLLGVVLETRDMAQILISATPYNQLDIEYATIADVRDLLTLFPLPEERRVKFVVNALIDIAMARAQIAKYYERVALLVKTYLEDKSLYGEIINYARKGAGNITDAEVEKFAERVSSGDDISQDCLTYAITVKQKSAEGSPYDQAVMVIAQLIFPPKI